jgi:hypothetical protein
MEGKRTIDIAFITCKDFPCMAEDDRVLVDRLMQLYPSFNVTFVVWTDFFQDTWTVEEALQKTAHYFKRVKLVFIRSPWDYFEKTKLFTKWLHTVVENALEILNPFESIIWNMNKIYLRQLKEVCNVNIVPTYFFQL